MEISGEIELSKELDLEKMFSHALKSTTVLQLLRNRVFLLFNTNQISRQQIKKKMQIARNLFVLCIYWIVL